MSKDRLGIRYIPLSQAKRWERNAKRHDIGGLIQSIQRYGFRDAPIFDETLGAVSAGNGRIEALSLLLDAGEDPPRGIRVSPGGEWMVPIQFGVDAETVSEAEAFAVDHNNLTVTGGETGVGDVMRLWDEGLLLGVLEGLDDLPVTLDSDDLDALANPPPSPKQQEETGGRAASSKKKKAVCPSCGTEFAA